VTGATTMESKSLLNVTFRNEGGLHARAAAAFCIAALRFKSTITVSRDGRAVNGKSVMTLLTLGCQRGDSVLIEAEGPDAECALDRLRTLVEHDLLEQD
jgi:phosphotransferase system HPr (HPr) family protein